MNIIRCNITLVYFLFSLSCAPHSDGSYNLEQEFFAELQDRETEFGITDIQLGLATLEEVFLNIARQAELESAAIDGTMVTLSLTSGASVQVNKIYFGLP